MIMRMVSCLLGNNDEVYLIKKLLDQFFHKKTTKRLLDQWTRGLQLVYLSSATGYLNTGHMFYFFSPSCFANLNSFHLFTGVW